MACQLPALKPNGQGPLVGLGVMYPAPGMIERIGDDWDWFWIDGQHGDLDFRDVADHVRACDLVGKPAIVRVPAQDPGWISKALDTGAAGVIVPMVESVEEARAMVQAAKFPPLGNRSYGGRRVIDRIGRDYYKPENHDVKLICQVESRAALDQIDALAAVEGVDGWFLGPDDFYLREGRSLNHTQDYASLEQPARQLAEACARHGKLSVMVTIADAVLEIARDVSFDLVVGGSDVMFVAQGSAAGSKRVRSFFAGRDSGAAAGKPTSLY